MKGPLFLFAAGFIATTALAQPDLAKLPPPATKKNVTYEADILPVFQSAACMNCHGPEKPKAGLRLDSLEAVLKGSKNGKVVAVGDSAKSDLVIAVAQIDPELSMPPKRRGPANRPQPAAGSQPSTPLPTPKALTSEQVSLVRAWIDQGAQ